MNKNRRKELAELSDRLADIKSDLEIIRDEEQEYFDNMPESLQSGEKGSSAESAINEMDEAIDNIEQAIDNVNSAQE